MEEQFYFWLILWELCDYKWFLYLVQNDENFIIFIMFIILALII